MKVHESLHQSEVDVQCVMHLITASNSEDETVEDDTACKLFRRIAQDQKI